MKSFMVAVLMVFFVGFTGVCIAEEGMAPDVTSTHIYLPEHTETIVLTQDEIKALKKALVPRPPAPAPKTLCDKGDVLCVAYLTKAGAVIIAAATKRDLLRASKREIDGLNRFMGLLTLLQAEASESEYVALAKKYLPKKWLQGEL